MSELKIIYIHRDKLQKFENNPRHLIDPESIKKLTKLIKEHGFQNPLQVYKEKKGYLILCGNHRFEAACSLGIEKFPCIIYEGNRKKAIARAISDNKSNEWTEYDIPVLKDLFADLDDGDFDMELTGFDDEEIKSMFDFEVENDEKDDDIPEVKESICKLGDLWQLGEHRLLCGDSTKKENIERLMDGKKADMVFTDPPFPNNSEIMKDMIKNIDIAFNNAKIVCDGLMLWFWDNLSFPPFEEKITTKLIWKKTNGWQAGHFETIYGFHRDGKRHEQLVFDCSNVGGENEREKLGFHETPKPVNLIIEIFKELKFKKIIIDLFLGSGPTLIACEKTNRECYGMEIDPHYCDVVIRRWEDFTNKKAKKIKT